MSVSVEQISKPSIPPHVTKVIQLSDKEKNRVKVTHKHYRDADGKETIKDSLDIDNPNGSDISKFLNHLEHGFGKSPESEIFNRVLEHINGIEAGEVKTELLSKTPVATQEQPVTTEKPSNDTPVKENKSDLNNFKFPKEGMKISSDEIKEAVFAMKQDLSKDKNKTNANS